MTLRILYRGSLSSCNYGCDYCPFAKHTETDAEHDADRRALDRFVAWVGEQCDRRISVLFTPWGEALVRKRYQDALVTLTNMDHVEKIAIQTNLSCRLDWVERCDKSKLGLWATYHPGEVTREKFLAQCLEADRRGVRFSVGSVGLKEHQEDIAALRAALPEHIYLWVNAYKRQLDYYTPDEIAHYTRIDPLFPVNTVRHPSVGETCQAGHTAISVDGDGVMRRCHFVREPIGNLYDPDFADALQPRLCANETCGCHIGYIHMDRLGQYDLYGDGLLERIPAQPVWRALPMSP
ncbi:MAG: STM4011 family radical SAM protein [Capsulimonas sp.]|uniref:STM4011 family radical SAM protein n=1 Tax=Capsulimonas sp. TaxID=2494211 RepID=UPI003267C7CE